MKNLKKFALKNPQFIKGGIDPIMFEEEFDLWIATLTDEQIKEINMMYNGMPDALVIYFKTVVKSGN